MSEVRQPQALWKSAVSLSDTIKIKQKAHNLYLKKSLHVFIDERLSIRFCLQVWPGWLFQELGYISLWAL